MAKNEVLMSGAWSKIELRLGLWVRRCVGRRKGLESGRFRVQACGHIR